MLLIFVLRPFLIEIARHLALIFARNRQTSSNTMDQLMQQLGGMGGGGSSGGAAVDDR
jgi:hypothetical protein